MAKLAIPCRANAIKITLDPRCFFGSSFVLGFSKKARKERGSVSISHSHHDRSSVYSLFVLFASTKCHCHR